jgi:hypothetical protein
LDRHASRRREPAAKVRLISKGLFSMRHIAIQRLSVFVTAVAFLYVAGVVLGVL